jgi:hypothetical protein
MQRFSKTTISIVILLAVNTCLFSQKNAVGLKDKRITVNMENKPLGYIFHRLVVNYDVPIGFERSETDRGNSDFDFTTIVPSSEKVFKNRDKNATITVKILPVFKAKKHFFTIKAVDKSLEDVLNIIVQQMEGYRWEINNDVVNIFPIVGRDRNYEKLLKMKIAKFNLGEREITGLIRNKLFALPEFSDFLNENNLNVDTTSSTADPDNLFRFVPNGISFSNITFKELLNKITKIKRGGWILKQHNFAGKKDEEYIDIDI